MAREPCVYVIIWRALKCQHAEVLDLRFLNVFGEESSDSWPGD